MARHRASVGTSRAPQDVFEYLSDLSSAPERDPGVVEANRVGDGPVGDPSELTLVAVFLGRRNTLTSRVVVDHAPPERGHLTPGELERRLTGQDHVRAGRLRHPRHLGRRALPDGPVAHRRPAARLRVQRGRRPGAGRSAGNARRVGSP